MMPVAPMPPLPGATNRAERGPGRSTEPDVPFQTVLDGQTEAAARREPAVADRRADAGRRGDPDAASGAPRRPTERRDADGAAAVAVPGDEVAQVDVGPDDGAPVEPDPVGAGASTVIGEQLPPPAPPAARAPVPTADPVESIGSSFAPPTPPIPHSLPVQANAAAPDVLASDGGATAPTFAAPNPPPVVEGGPGAPRLEVAAAPGSASPDDVAPSVTTGVTGAAAQGSASPDDVAPSVTTGVTGATAPGGDRASTATSVSTAVASDGSSAAAAADSNPIAGPSSPNAAGATSTSIATPTATPTGGTAPAEPVVAGDAVDAVEPDPAGRSTEHGADEARPAPTTTPAPSADHAAASASGSTRPTVAATTAIADRATAATVAPPPTEPLDVLADAELRRVGSTTTRLGLDVATERLGTIRVDAVDRGGELHLNLSSDRAATRNLLAGELSSLRSDLTDGGGSVHVDVGDRHHAAPDRPSITPDDRAVATSAGPAGPLPPPDPTAVAHGRLDLRL